MDWRTCALDSCSGVRIDGFERCLAHLEPSRQDQFFVDLHLGAEVDLRGTELSEDLVRRLVDAVGSIDGRRSEFGRADFTEARFHGFAVFEDVTFFEADFTDAEFEGAAKFDMAGFRDGASFLRTRFGGRTTFKDASFEDTKFESTEFADEVRFDRAKFTGSTFKRARFHTAVWFDGAKFEDQGDFLATGFGGHASFRETAFLAGVNFSPEHGFAGDISFDKAEFSGDAEFDGLEFRGRASFQDTVFGAAALFERSRFHRRAWFDDARFQGAVTFEGTRFGEETSFDGADFETAERFGPLRGGNLTLRHANFRRRTVLDVNVTELDCTETVFEGGVTILVEFAKADLERAVFGKASTVTAGDSIAGVLSVRGTDVADLVFTDLDLSMCLFAGAHHLDKLRLEGDCRFASYRKRQVLREEQIWRLKHPEALRPRRTADLYRQLRKAQEDSKNEPGAADFYYGEMEMRRLSPATPWPERVILYLYWLVSGYGLRALRALATLVVLIAVVSLGFWLGGFKGTAAFGETLIYVAQSTVSLETKLASLPKDLTAFGEVMRLVVRVLGPLLLGLALLAVRNRVKR